MRSASFTFYPQEFRSDPMVCMMTLPELGAYMTDVCAAVETGDATRLEQLRRSWIGRVYWRRNGQREAISPTLRRAVHERDGGQCRQCLATERLEIDHVVPYSKGGATTLDNLQLLCKRCNCVKGAKMPASANPSFILESR